VSNLAEHAAPKLTAAQAYLASVEESKGRIPALPFSPRVSASQGPTAAVAAYLASHKRNNSARRTTLGNLHQATTAGIAMQGIKSRRLPPLGRGRQNNLFNRMRKLPSPAINASNADPGAVASGATSSRAASNVRALSGGI